VTVHIPRWTLLIAGLLVAAGIGFAASQVLMGSDDEGPAATTDADVLAAQDDAGDGAAEAADGEDIVDGEQLPCDEQAATQAARRAGVELLVGDPRSARQIGRGFGYQVLEVECADLTGDGADEMLVELACCTGSALDPWGVFRQEDDEWELLLTQPEHNVSGVEIEGKTVIERTPTYGPKDPFATPRGERQARFEFAADGSYAYEAEGLPSDPVLAVRELGHARIGSFRTATEGPAEAVDAFGEPSMTSKPERESCSMLWSDLGLEMLFANFGGGNPCRLGGAQQVTVRGLSAQLVDWETDRGLVVGAPAAEVFDLYPDATPGEDGLFDLDKAYTPYGDVNEYATVSTRIHRGEVVEIVLRPLAAGD